jgi:hypothetical protein
MLVLMLVKQMFLGAALAHGVQIYAHRCATDLISVCLG